VGVVVGMRVMGEAAREVAQDMSEQAASPRVAPTVDTSSAKLEEEPELEPLPEPEVADLPPSAASTVASWKSLPAPIDNDLPPVGDLPVREASRLVGQNVRVLATDGEVHWGLLESASDGKLLLVRHLSSGTFSYEIEMSSVESLRGLYRTSR
jgi:hypothetical protein